MGAARERWGTLEVVSRKTHHGFIFLRCLTSSQVTACLGYTTVQSVTNRILCDWGQSGESQICLPGQAELALGQKDPSPPTHPTATVTSWQAADPILQGQEASRTGQGFLGPLAGALGPGIQCSNTLALWRADTL